MNQERKFTSQTVQVETSEGMAEATKTALGEWLITTPWGDWRFAGTVTEVKAAIKQRELRETGNAELS